MQLAELASYMLIMNQKRLTEEGVLYCCPKASPPLTIWTPGVAWISDGFPGPPGHEAGLTDMKPITKSGWSSAIFTAAAV